MFHIDRRSIRSTRYDQKKKDRHYFKILQFLKFIIIISTQDIISQ
jgi:hypothetical protein